MLGLLFAAALLVIALVGITLRKTYYYLPPKELKRQAEQGDKLARTLYQVVSYGASLRVLLWLLVGFSSAGGVVLLARSAPWWIGFMATTLLLWLAFSWLPNTRVTAVGAHLAVWATPIIAGLLGYLHPVLSRIGEPFHRHYKSMDHTGLYEIDDLVELVEKQKAQDDNRVPTVQLEALKKVLTAHNYKIGDVLTPRAELKTVSDDDTIGLVLLDELHASGQSSFPVAQGKTDKVIGALYLQDLNLKTEGKVRDYMHKSVRYLHEEDSLAQALQAFFKTKQQLFVVVNSFEEYLGVVTLEHILKQLTGGLGVDGFDQHDDLAAVANKHAHDDEEDVVEVEPEPEEASVPEPEHEVSEPESETETVTDAPAEDEPEEDAAEEVEPQTPKHDTDEDPELEALSMEDGSDDATEHTSDEPVDPDNLAALDLPDEEETSEELGEGSHITFEKPKTKKPKTKKSEPETPESDS